MKRIALAFCTLAVLAATGPAFAGGSGCPGAAAGGTTASAGTTQKGG